MTDAFADRLPIDWDALVGRVRDPAGRTAVEALRRLDALRGSSRAAGLPPERFPRSILLRLLVAAAALQVAFGLGVAIAAIGSAQSLRLPAPTLLLTATFGAAGLLLGSASPRDHRIFLLMATFTLAASAFARALLSDLPRGWPASSIVLFDGIYPEAFAQAAFWRFAVVFPRVERFAPFDVFARRAAAVAWWLAVGLFVANLSIASGVRSDVLAALGRDHPGNLFWHLFAAAALPAAVTILVRAGRAPAAERKKVARLAHAMGVCAAPFLLIGLSRLALPGVDRWFLATGGGARLWLDAAVIGGLAALPVLVTLAVIVDRPFELRAMVPARVRSGTARGAAWLHRALRWPISRPLSYPHRLTSALDRLRLARGPRDIMAVLRRELQDGVACASVRMLDVGALPVDTALMAILEASPAPVDLSRDREPFVLMPAREREWLEATGAALAAAMRLRDGTITAVALLAPRSTGDPFGPLDHWFVSTLLTGAAAAWDASAPRNADSETGELALECPRCGALDDVEPLSCRCGVALALAGLPRSLGGKFEVRRRLGAGGMGIVYLGYDSALGRDVALKTLPVVRDGVVTRLHDEARVMASLNHEALATIYGLEVWRRTPVLVVEYFAGGTLAERLAAGCMPAQEVVRLGIRLADALTYMHACGVLHRDVKPSNIGFTADGRPKLLDFGLATSRERLAGTPAYFPPEALAGATPDAGRDLWGLSTVLLHAGRQHGEPPDLLRAFFHRALAPEPRDRFGSSAELRRALHQLVR